MPQDIALPPGSVVTTYGGTADTVTLTGRVEAPVEQVLTHFRSAVERAGFVLQRDEDEGRSGELGFFGARADGTLAIAKLTCPTGTTGFTLRLRGA